MMYAGNSGHLMWYISPTGGVYMDLPRQYNLGGQVLKYKFLLL